MVEARVDLGEKRNLLISSIILVLGIGGAELVFTDVHRVSSMAMAAVVGIILHATLPGKETAGDTERILGEA